MYWQLSVPLAAQSETGDSHVLDLAPSVPPNTEESALSETGDEKRVSPLELLGHIVQPDDSARLRWTAGETFYGSNLDTPVYVIHGAKPGPVLCLTAAIHGDELNGVEITRRLIDTLSPNKLSGTVIGVPIVNLLGFTRGERYLPDRRDLNRYFPGNPAGSSASRIAASFFQEIVSKCNYLVDIHTGSLNRTNMAQIRANLNIPTVFEFTRMFGSTAVLHSRKLRGNLRSAAVAVGIPAVALELGEPGSLQKKRIEEGVSIIETLLGKLDMVRTPRLRHEPQPVYYSSRWVRVDNGGLLTTRVKIASRVRKGTVLGTLVNPLSNESVDVISPYNGRVLGMALNQFMLPGYAAFNIGIVKDEEEVLVDAATFECQGTTMEPAQLAEEFSCESEDNEEIDIPDPGIDSTTLEETEPH